MTVVRKWNDCLQLEIDETGAANATEIWIFDNSRGDEPHPIHLHGEHFQILERSGARDCF